MRFAVFKNQILPFIFLYSSMILLTIVIDYILHYFQLGFLGRYFGTFGLIILILSFVYSLRKRKIIESGSPKKLLLMHEYMALGGSVFILVHAGIHFNALLPWLAILVLLINVASGLVGKYLLRNANDSLHSERQKLINAGIHISKIDKLLFFDTVSVDIMKKWRSIHLPISLMLAILTLIHIMSVFILRA